MQLAAGRSSLLEAIPSPRILSTHLPYSMLPDSITSSDCRIIYACRDPKDVLVSDYHFMYEFFGMSAHKAPFNEIFDVFCDGSSTYCPIWDHVLGYWKQSVTKSEKILFLKYEEMLQDTVNHVKRIAEFIGCPFSEVEKKDGMVEQIVELCSFQKQKDLKVNKTTVPGIFEKQLSHADFFRKGSVGDWNNHMTPEMAQKLDVIIQEKFEVFGFHIIPKVNVESASI
ncbi:hypothetical protein LUZ60_003032 [Juncus effusus]|nr:hypothetical protein LUZ60_003032 [Juncus effusus]